MAKSRVAGGTRARKPTTKNSTSSGVSKRKAVSKKPTTARTVPARTVPAASFRLLDLPAELRNRVYEYAVIDNQTVVVHATGKGCVKSRHSLYLVCRQIHVEFGGVLGRHAISNAQHVIANVTDFNFRPLLSFFSRLAKNKNANLNDFATHRRLEIHFKLTSAWCKNPDLSGIEAWSNWFKKMGKANVNIKWFLGVKEVEDNALAEAVIKNLTSGTGPFEFKDLVRHAFENYFMYGACYDDELQAKDDALVEAHKARKLAEIEERMAVQSPEDADYMDDWEESDVDMSEEGE